MGLPTDGPRPLVIDHRQHLHTHTTAAAENAGVVFTPLDCHRCGEELAERLISLVKEESLNGNKQKPNLPSKNKFAFKFNGSKGFGKNPRAGSPASPDKLTSAAEKPSGQKLESFFDNRALQWSDIVIASSNLNDSCNFYKAMAEKGVPIEMAKDTKESVIDLSNEKTGKLFIAKPKQLTGLERPVVVFVPSAVPELSKKENDSCTSPSNLLLSNMVSRYSAADAHALWFSASRSLASLIFVLP